MSKLIGTDGKLLNPREEDLVAHIPLPTFKKMQDDLLFLECLRQAGIDNWSGYEEAQTFFEGLKANLEGKTKDELEKRKQQVESKGDI